MKRFEYKLVKLARGGWFTVGATRQALVDFLNREGRDGWRLAPMPAGLATWRLLLEREIAP